MGIKKGQKLNRPPGVRMIKTFQLVSKGVPLKKAQRLSGYSEAYVKSCKMLNTKTYQEALQKAGLTAGAVGGVVKQLTFSDRHEQRSFPDRIKRIKVGKRYVTEYSPVSDKEIKKIIQAMSGAKLTTILRDHSNHAQIAYFIVPNETARKYGLEFVHKSQGLYAPEQVGIIPIEISPEEKKNLDTLFKDILKK